MNLQDLKNNDRQNFAGPRELKQRLESAENTFSRNFGGSSENFEIVTFMPNKKFTLEVTKDNEKYFELRREEQF